MYDQELADERVQALVVAEQPDDLVALSHDDELIVEELERNTTRQLFTVLGGSALMGLGFYSYQHGSGAGEGLFCTGAGINVMAGLHMWLNSLRKNKIEYSGR